MSIETLERKVAGKARELVQQYRQENDPKHENESAYRSLCEGLPILLRNAGLAQAATFLRAKREVKEECGQAYDDMERQLRGLGFLKNEETLLEVVTKPSLTSSQYRLLFEMTALIAYWHKRMAQALLRKKDEK